MKKLLVILSLGLLAGFVSAQCSEYVHLAEDRLAPPYPNYLGAAGEYLHAAECYEAENDLQNANTYYAKTAQHYVIAAGLLVEGGDYFQKAKAYELAADSFYKIGDRQSALTYYKKANDIYATNGFPNEASALTGLIAERFNEDQAATDWGLIASIFVVIVAVSLFIFWRYGQRSGNDTEEPKAREAPREKPELNEKRLQSFEKTEVMRKPPAVYDEPTHEAEGPRSQTPKEKLAKKLREKYTPKY
mgnify:CR=1 FL=1